MTWHNHKITLNQFADTHASSEQVEAFGNAFPDGLRLTDQNLLTAAKELIDLRRLGETLADGEAGRVFRQRTMAAQQAYAAARVEIMTAYCVAVASALIDALDLDEGADA